MLNWDERQELRRRIRAVVTNPGIHPECHAAFVESLVHEYSDTEHEQGKVREKVQRYLADIRSK